MERPDCHWTGTLSPNPHSNVGLKSGTNITISTWAHSNFKQMLGIACGKMKPLKKFHLSNETTDWSHLNTKTFYFLLSEYKQQTFFFKELLYHIECRILFVSMKITCKSNFSLEFQLLLTFYLCASFSSAHRSLVELKASNASPIWV